MYDVQQLQGLLAKSKTEAPVINLAEITVQAEPQPQTRYLIVLIFVNNQFELHHILMIFDSQTYIRLSIYGVILIQKFHPENYLWDILGTIQY